ncbi:PREDICTED: cytochrome P450 6a9-like [Wasmannia auropunctata]|uniref:cytochrome P450 6a9-like n=1 Tax=Wasmannia auropunctata TaxID=64793 RepID=UPI0005F08A67|nr:PREDICTED: cytochrome P450 6a9-like [Wasmannia auropunctata]
MKYKHHRVVGMYSLFKPVLLINDPELIRTVLTKEFGSFHDRGLYCNEKVDPLSNHLFLISGKKWRNMRVKMTPTFTSGKLKQMFSLLKECGDELANYLKSKAQIKDSIEIKDMFARIETALLAVGTTVSKLTMVEATAQSYIFFLAGFETSSTTATFALYELAQHQDIQDKVCKEIDEILAKYGDLTYDAVNEMAYLHKVIKGMRFGYMQTKVGIVSLLSKYRFKLHSRTQVPITFDERNPLLSPKGGIYLIIEPR